MEKIILSTKKAPAAIGPYSQGVSTGKMVFTSGQLAIDIATGELCTGSIGEQTKMSLNNVKAVLEAGGATMENVIKTTIFLKDLSNFVEVNTAYSEFFSGETAPARSCVEVAKLPKDAEIEIEAIAII